MEPLTIYLIVFSFVVGAVAGSFVTAWVWRARHGRSMTEKHSICPNCAHPLGARDLIPIVSWLMQQGRCRFCAQPISTQYVAIEVSCATLFAIATYWVLMQQIHPGAILAPWPLANVLFLWVNVVLLVSLFVYDLRWSELPDIWTIGGALLSFIMLLAGLVLRQPALWRGQGFYGSPSIDWGQLVASVASGLLAALFFFAIVWGSEKILHKPGMGLGDLKLALYMGLFLGFPAIAISVYVAFIFGAVLSLALIAGKQKNWGQSLPFGPFLIVGVALALTLSPDITAWYLQFLT